MDLIRRQDINVIFNVLDNVRPTYEELVAFTNERATVASLQIAAGGGQEILNTIEDEYRVIGHTHTHTHTRTHTHTHTHTHARTHTHTHAHTHTHTHIHAHTHTHAPTHTHTHTHTQRLLREIILEQLNPSDQFSITITPMCPAG